MTADEQKIISWVERVQRVDGQRTENYWAAPKILQGMPMKYGEQKEEKATMTKLIYHGSRAGHHMS